MQLLHLTTRTRLILAPFVISSIALAQAPSTGGDVRFRTDQPDSVLRRGWVDLDHIQVFQEQSGLSLPLALRVTKSTPTQVQWDDEIPTGTAVDVYLIHQDTDTSSQFSNSGWIQFPHEVLGYIDETGKLNQTDGSVGADGTQYPSNDSEGAKRGLENHDLIHIDWISGRFDITLRTMKKVDEIRVVTRSSGGSSPYVAHCFGDGSSGNCPCGNNVPSGTAAGCLNSASSGGRLSPGGSNSVDAANFSLILTDLFSLRFAIVFMGNPQAAAAMPFGEGLLCVSPGPTNAGFLRFPIQFSDHSGSLVQSDIVAYTQAHFSGPNQISSGKSFNFQGYYRDPANVACNGGGFNLTNALTVTFGQ